MTQLPDDLAMSFSDFLDRYQAACSAGSTAEIMRHVAPDYVGDYVYPAGNYRRFDRQALEEGWKAAEESFAAAGARWRFENVVTAAREDERIAVYWVAFVIEGQETGWSLVTATFRWEEGRWLLAREHVQHRVQRNAE
jgi:ketosteroid isomerase-like protein